MNPLQMKIQRHSGRLFFLLKLGFIISLFISFLAIVGINILSFSSEATRKSFLAAFHQQTAEGIILEIISSNLFLLFIFMLIYGLFISQILYLIYTIFRDISAVGTPFDLKHTGRMKQLSVWIVLISLNGNFFDSFADLYTIGEMSWHMNFLGVILRIIIYFLALIFEYGCELQRPSDEAL